MARAVLVTAPRDDAEELANTLVEEKLAACANIFDVTSIYRWEGEVQRDDEAQIILKTGDAAIENLVTRIRELHSYDLPEILALDIGGSQEYLAWLEQETSTEGEAA